MKDLGESKNILGVEIFRNREKGSLTISQHNYCSKILKKFIMPEAKVVAIPLAQHFKLSYENSPKENEEEHLNYMLKIPYSQVVDSLMYFMISTRPNLSYSTNLVSQYIAKSGKRHWETSKCILRYLKGIQEAKLLYKTCYTQSYEIYGFVDADYAGDLNKRMSLIGYVFRLGGNLLSWKAILQPMVALSSIEAEFVALTEAIKEGIWFKGLLKDYEINTKRVKIYCDNYNVIHLSKNQQFYNKTKHINIKFHFVRNQIENGDIEILKVHTTENAANMMTKPLA